MSDNLTPTAQAILERLREHPATAADLREATGRGRSTIDKALTDLTKTGLIAKTTPDGEEDDGPALWTLTDPDHNAVTAAGAPEPDDTATTPDAPAADAEDGRDDDAPAVPADADDPDPADPPPGEPDHNPDAQGADGTTPAETEVKVCRGCGEQMPRICPACGSKTTSYCGTCRTTRPTRRRAPGEPQILANGLPKLRPGQLEHLVADVITTQPLPDHLGITGWTPGRVAIFLPGRSTGAIANALDKLTATGRAHLIGEDPKRYQPTPKPQPAEDDDEQHAPADNGNDQ